VHVKKIFVVASIYQKHIGQKSQARMNMFYVKKDGTLLTLS